MDKEIKYKYAVDSSGKIVNINTINRDFCQNEKYLCIDCGQELIPKLGNIRIHHLSHKYDVYSCSKESYLHKLGKKLFYEIYLQCLNAKEPFFIITPIIVACKYKKISNTQTCMAEVGKIDLTTFFTNIECEKEYDGFRPDLTLLNNNEKIFIEIVNTHYSDEKKVNSNNRIIEIDVKDESSIDSICDKILTNNNRNIHFINFNIPIIGEITYKDINPGNYYLLDQYNNILFSSSHKCEFCKFLFFNNNKLGAFKGLHTTFKPSVSYLNYPRPRRTRRF
jgi:hypothetical protein